MPLPISESVRPAVPRSPARTAARPARSAVRRPWPRRRSRSGHWSRQRARRPPYLQALGRHRHERAREGRMNDEHAACPVSRQPSPHHFRSNSNFPILRPLVRRPALRGPRQGRPSAPSVRPPGRPLLPPSRCPQLARPCAPPVPSPDSNFSIRRMLRPPAGGVVRPPRPLSARRYPQYMKFFILIQKIF